MSTSNWMMLTPRANKSEFWQTSNKAFRFILDNWKHSIAVIVALAALVGEAYIIIQAYKEGKVVHFETSDEVNGPKNRTYFFWLALGIVVACANNLVIAGLATFKNAYLKTDREKNTKWLWPLFAAYVCMTGLMAGVLPAALKRHDSPSAFAVVSILSIYFQSILWAIILGWRDVEKTNKSGGPSPVPAAPPICSRRRDSTINNYLSSSSTAWSVSTSTIGLDSACHEDLRETGRLSMEVPFKIALFN